jgi:hypothetical protein
MYSPRMPDIARADFERQHRRVSFLRRILFDAVGAIALAVLLSSTWWAR